MSDSQPAPDSATPVSAPAAGSIPRPPSAGRPTYAQRVAERAARRAIAQETATRVCTQFGEANIAAVARLVDLFGPEFIEAQAAQAHVLLAAAAGGAPPHPVLQTRTGQPRTPGGVFFQLMQEHATGLGLYWPALALPSPPTTGNVDRGTRNRNGAPQAGARPASAAPGPPAPAVATPAPVAPPPLQEPGILAPPRPARAKLTVVGSLAGPPQEVPGPDGPLVELPFRCEMTPTLPKGLPVLGPTPVRVWCTPKQWGKVRAGLSGATRLIAGGEAALTTDAAGAPLLRLVCLNLRTLEPEPVGPGTAAAPP